MRSHSASVNANFEVMLDVERQVQDKAAQLFVNARKLDNLPIRKNAPARRRPGALKAFAFLFVVKLSREAPKAHNNPGANEKYKMWLKRPWHSFGTKTS